MRTLSARRLVLTCCSWVALTAGLQAQNLVGFDGASGDVIFFTGVPGPCTYPAGPIQANVPLITTAACAAPPLPGFPSATTEGAVGVQEDGMISVTGGTIAGRYDASGQLQSSSDFSAWGLGPLTGSAVERGAATGSADSYWYTDGTKVNKFSAALPCGGLPGLVFAVSFTSYGGPGLLTGLAFDHSDGTIWACTSLGRVVHFNQSGTELSSFTQPLASLSGIAVDDASGTVYVTDGSVVAGYDAMGNLTTDFWWPNGAESAPGFFVGLDWIPAPLSYGTASAPAGSTPPVVSSDGWAYLGNAAFDVEVSGDPGSNFLLFYTFAGNLCPAVGVLGLDLWIAAPFFGGGSAAADSAGLAKFAAPIPTDPALMVGVDHAQVAALLAGGGLASSQGLVFSIAAF